MKTIWSGAAAAASLLSACPALAASPTAPATAAPAPDLTAAPRLGAWGYDLTSRDASGEEVALRLAGPGRPVIIPTTFVRRRQAMGTMREGRFDLGWEGMTDDLCDLRAVHRSEGPCLC